MKDDTISRAAAIDALEKVAELFPWRVPGNRDSYDRYNEAWNDSIGRAEIEIEKLPSAQQWIPCKERLPKEMDAGILKKIGINRRSDYVLATVEVKGERMTVTSCTHDGVWDWNMKYAFPDYKVVAWMPLPEPYKEDEDDE